MYTMEFKGNAQDETLQLQHAANELEQSASGELLVAPGAIQAQKKPDSQEDWSEYCCRAP